MAFLRQRRLAATALGLLAAACSSSFGPPAPPPPAPEVFGPLGERTGVDERIALEHLSGPVDAVRDRLGRLHIYASTEDDALRVQGYLCARDRSLQLELYRRLAEGRLAALLGDQDPSLLETDIAFRQLGLHRVAKAQLAALGGEIEHALDAYADGVSQLLRKIRSGEQSLPEGLGHVDPAVFSDWDAVDSLAVARLPLWASSYSADGDIGLDGLLADMKATFREDDPDPALRARAGMERDLVRFAPVDLATTSDGLPGAGQGTQARSRPRRQHARPPSASRRHLVERAAGFARALERGRALLAPRGLFGSNAWALVPGRSFSGHALLASDPHLALTAPSALWPVALHVGDPAGGGGAGALDAAGVALPGVPGVILGQTRDVAWASAASGYDVTDVYAETMTPDGKAVLFHGEPVALESTEETIELAGGGSYAFTALRVPHHGPVVPAIVDGKIVPPDPAEGALSVRSTVLDPTREPRALFDLMHAASAGEALAALAFWEAGAASWLVADSSGEVYFSSRCRMPERGAHALDWDPASYDGLLPCLVLPGDGSAEWTGYWPADAIPAGPAPIAGYVATANNDPVGGTADGDPANDERPDGGSAFLACSFDPGFRQGRIRRLIDEHLDPFSLDDLAAIQADVRSPLGEMLVPHLLGAIDNAQAEHKKKGSHPQLAAVVADPLYDSVLVGAARDSLAFWHDDLDCRAASGVDLETNQPLSLDLPEAQAAQATLIFNAWLVRLLGRVLDDELARLGRSETPFDVRGLLHVLAADPPTLATYQPELQDSALWDDLGTPELETRQERMVRALLDALVWLRQAAGDDIAAYRWGMLHRVRLPGPAPGLAQPSLPPDGDPVFPDGFPRPGDAFVVDAAQHALRQPPGQDLSFAFAAGPAERVLFDLDPAGVRSYAAIAGGAVWDPASAHFGDQAELWRRNQTRLVPFALADVLADQESRTVLAPAR
ncbi:MAG: penicillin acylase family protein [Deltaproteobacteria bacterium]|nr:penicillin acylase family protein [Deltaproteobacteria bacterium]